MQKRKLSQTTKQHDEWLANNHIEDGEKIFELLHSK